MVKSQERQFAQATEVERIAPPPRQRWYLAQRGMGDGRIYWNLVYFVEVLNRIEPDIVRQVVTYLLQQYDSLRFRTRHDGTDFYYIITSIDDEELPFAYEDLSGVEEQELAVTVETIVRRYQESLNVIDGPLLRVVLFDPGPEKTQRLLIIVSHAACDIFSFQLLIRDFVSLYYQVSQELPVRLPRRTTAVKDWYAVKADYARTQEFQEELKYWKSLPWRNVCPLPLDYPENRHINTRDSIRTVTAALTPEETKILLRDLPRMAQAQILDILLAAFLQTLRQWSGSSIQAFFLVNNGRITPFPGVNLARTFGNLIAVPQIVLDAGVAATIEELLTSVKKQVQAIPSNGLMWEWLPIELTLKSELSFNYLGVQATSKQVGTDTPWFRPAPESAGAQDNPKEEHWTLISCTAIVKDKQFLISWDYSENLYQRTTIEKLAQSYIGSLRVLLTSFSGT